MDLKYQTVEIDREEITYLRAGKGQPIVLLPGLGVDCALWRQVVPLLARDFEVFAFSLPIYNSRNKVGHKYTLNTLYKFLSLILDSFGIRNPILVGHSLGGLVSLVFTAKHPEKVNKLVLVSSPLSNHKERPPISWTLFADIVAAGMLPEELIKKIISDQKLLERILMSFLPPKSAIRDTESIESLMQRMTMEPIASCFLDLITMNFENYILNLKTPTLIVFGTNDAVLSGIHGTTMYSEVPNSEVISLACEHYIPSDKPVELAVEIKKFIDKDYLEEPRKIRN